MPFGTPKCRPKQTLHAHYTSLFYIYLLQCSRNLQARNSVYFLGINSYLSIKGMSIALCTGNMLHFRAREYHCPAGRVIKRVAAVKSEVSSLTKAGTLSLPTHTIVLPLPVMNTDSYSPVACSFCLSSSSSGSVSNAGCSRSLTQRSGRSFPQACISLRRRNGSS